MFTVFAVTQSGVGLSNTYSTRERALQEAKFAIHVGYSSVEILTEETSKFEAVKVTSGGQVLVNGEPIA